MPEITALKDKCQMALANLILEKVPDGDAKDNALTALDGIDTAEKPKFWELIENITDWQIQWALMRFWIIVNERR